jgi:transposase
MVLTRESRNCRLAIDDDAAERELTVVAFGCERSPLADSDDGGECVAAIYNRLGAAKLNDLDPEAWLGRVLESIANDAINRIGKQLPWNVFAKLSSLRVAACA